jgi:4-hydroxyproline epimerase
VIFFNNVGYLGMCGHGTIGVMATLSFLKKIQPGKYYIETPVGIVTTELHSPNDVSVTNVPSYRYRKDVAVEVDGIGKITGDIAWGGNWFFLIRNHHQNIALDNVEHLTAFTWKVREALERNNIRGKGNQEIDHIELFGPGKVPGTHSRNFVLCPGKAYDRSPCGTGTSAKLACLYEDGNLREGEIWKQESITGSVFEGSIQVIEGQITPTIRGSAFITAESTLLFNNLDPLKWGIR